MRCAQSKSYILRRLLVDFGVVLSVFRAGYPDSDSIYGEQPGGNVNDTSLGSGLRVNALNVMSQVI